MFLIVVDSIWIYYFSIKLISNLLAVAKYNDISKYYGIANNFLFFFQYFLHRIQKDQLQAFVQIFYFVYWNQIEKISKKGRRVEDKR